eukprot:184462_1
MGNRKQRFVVITKKKYYPTREQFQRLSLIFQTDIKVIRQWFYKHCKTILLALNKINANTMHNHYVPIINHYIISNCGLLWNLHYKINDKIQQEISDIAKISMQLVLKIV